PWLPPDAATTPAAGILRVNRFVNAPRVLNEPECCRSSSFSTIGKSVSPKSAPRTSTTGVTRTYGRMTSRTSAISRRPTLLTSCLLLSIAMLAPARRNAATGGGGGRRGPVPTTWRRTRRAQMEPSRPGAAHACRVVTRPLPPPLARVPSPPCDVDMELASWQSDECGDGRGRRRQGAREREAAADPQLAQVAARAFSAAARRRSRARRRVRRVHRRQARGEPADGQRALAGPHARRARPGQADQAVDVLQAGRAAHRPGEARFPLRVVASPSP